MLHFGNISVIRSGTLTFWFITWLWQTPQTTCRVGIYVSKKLSVTEVTFNRYSHYEHVWISIKLMGHDTLLVGCIYRSPSSYTLQSTLGLCNLITVVNVHSHLLICGDFKYPDIDWSSNSCSSHCSQLFLDTVQDKYLSQHVETPTTKFDTACSWKKWWTVLIFRLL